LEPFVLDLQPSLAPDEQLVKIRLHPSEQTAIRRFRWQRTFKRLSAAGELKKLNLVCELQVADIRMRSGKCGSRECVNVYGVGPTSAQARRSSAGKP
jgi:hypothetical protein